MSSEAYTGISRERSGVEVKMGPKKGVVESVAAIHNVIFPLMGDESLTPRPPGYALNIIICFHLSPYFWS
jgi:hypothetical protein